MKADWFGMEGSQASLDQAKIISLRLCSIISFESMARTLIFPDVRWAVAVYLGYGQYFQRS